jgi:membrane protein implicated in regulation of membrane protease activity
MKGAGLLAMDDDPMHRDALAAAGYTGLRGAIAFSLLLGIVGALVGSVLFAIIWNMLVPGSTEVQSTLVGASAGALFGIVMGLLKVQRGNMEAREEVEDKAWRRQMRRELGR